MTIFDVPGKQKLIQELEARMGQQDFWQDGQRAAMVTKQASALKTVVDRWEVFSKEIDDLADLVELAEEAQDEEVSAEIAASLEKMNKDLEALELESMLAGPDDPKNA
ncbi:MAG: PCRF domain-containing protein, partial [bacterium]